MSLSLANFVSCLIVYSLPSPQQSNSSPVHVQSNVFYIKKKNKMFSHSSHTTVDEVRSRLWTNLESIFDTRDWQLFVLYFCFIWKKLNMRRADDIYSWLQQLWCRENNLRIAKKLLSSYQNGLLLNTRSIIYTILYKLTRSRLMLQLKIFIL